MAMTIISRDPGRYGFSPPPEAPHAVEVLDVSERTQIRHIADAAGTTVTHLRAVNLELVGSATPSIRPATRFESPGASPGSPTISKGRDPRHGRAR